MGVVLCFLFLSFSFRKNVNIVVYFSCFHSFLSPSLVDLESCIGTVGDRQTDVRGARNTIRETHANLLTQLQVTKRETHNLHPQ
jgi:hypothetical protein